MRESAIESHVVKWAKDHGIRPFKQSGQGERGKSDRYFLRRGITAFLELKATGESATPLQAKKLQEHRDDLFEAECHNTIAGAIGFLKRVFRV